MTLAVVTGSNRGIGLEITRQLHGKGYKVCAACRRASPELTALGVRIIEGVDVGSDDCIKVLASALDGENIDLIVANAGVFRMDGPGIDGIDKHFPEMVEQFNVNTLGPIRTVCGLDKCLKEGSKVAIIGSLFGSIAENADGGMFGYRMSKAAVSMAGVNLAHALKERGIAVGLIHPGFVETDMTAPIGAKAGQGDCISTVESAEGIIDRIEKDLKMETTGRFWHTNGTSVLW